MRHLAIRIGWVALAVATAACADMLGVQNNNNPDVARVLSTAAGIEQVISTQFQSIHTQLAGNTLRPQAAALALESYGSVANFNMAVRAAIPRLVIQNDRGNATSTEDYNDFREMQKTARLSANAIRALDNLTSSGGSLGSTGRNLRARAFAFFTLGVALGDAALAYDSAAITTPAASAGDSIATLQSHVAVMQAALADLDSALAITTSATVAANAKDFTLPSTWINGVSLAPADFAKVIHSFKARFRAGVARTPSEREVVDWDAVLADATAGITTDLDVTLTNSGGWPMGFLAQMYTYGGWSMAAPAYVAFADTAGAFDAWLSKDLSQRAGADGTQFLFIRTPDRRFPAGDDRKTQQTNSGLLPTNGYPYFMNRPTGDDTKGDPWAQSQYDHYRFRYLTYKNSNRDGLWPWFTQAENDLLAAEAYIRKGNIGAAAALIDRTRTKAGLPPLTGNVTTATDPVPGGGACVPRVPTAASQYKATACGDILEAMKYEKRLETLYTGYLQWWVDSRGWGDLPEGTALEFPVPYQEMDARAHPFYNLGGVGGRSSAGKGTYGY